MEFSHLCTEQKQYFVTTILYCVSNYAYVMLSLKIPKVNLRSIILVAAIRDIAAEFADGMAACIADLSMYKHFVLIIILQKYAV